MNYSLLELLAELKVLHGETAEIRLSGGTCGSYYDLRIEACWLVGGKLHTVQRNISKMELLGAPGVAIGRACEQILHRAGHLIPDHTAQS